MLNKKILVAAAAMLCASSAVQAQGYYYYFGGTPVVIVGGTVSGSATSTNAIRLALMRALGGGQGLYRALVAKGAEVDPQTGVATAQISMTDDNGNPVSITISVDADGNIVTLG